MKAGIIIAAGGAVHVQTIATAQRIVFRLVCRWIGFLGFAVTALGPRPTQAAVIDPWVQRYSNIQSNAAAQAIQVVRDAAGDVIVTGSTGRPGRSRHIVTIKYSGSDGSVIWQQGYTNPLVGEYRPSALAVDRSGNVVVTGNADIGSIATVNLGYTAKYAAADGALLWEKHGNGTPHRLDAIRAVAVDDTGNVVVAGYSSSGVGSELYTAKFAAADGAMLWETRYGSGNGNFTAVAVDGSGNVLVTGRDNLLSCTAKFAAADGALLWEKRSNDPTNRDDSPIALAVDHSANVVIAGSSFNGTNTTGFTAKYAGVDGALHWEKRNIGYVNAMAIDANENVLIMGGSWDVQSDNYVIKYAAAAGELLWEKHNNKGSGAAMMVDDIGNVVVTGSSHNGANTDYYTAKYAAADGAMLWEKRYNGPANRDDSAYAVVVDGSGSVVITGTADVDSRFEWNSGDYYTAKYAAADGALLWEQSYDLAPHDAYAQAVAVDGSGNVVVTGPAASKLDSFSNTVNDYYTAKYAAGNGALVWEKRYNGPANGDDSPTALAVDGSGNVVVTGGSHNGANTDFYTAKYAAADGALLWEERYNGPANGHDSANAMALDGNGNVVVTGYSYNGATNNSYTAKYAASNGALLWERRDDRGNLAMAVDGSGNVLVTGNYQNGTNNNYTAKYAAADGALLWQKSGIPAWTRALAVDGSGNAVVAGYFYNGTNTDFYTAKYAAGDGALLWEKRYNGPANDNDYATALSVDRGGNVVVTGYSGSGGGDSFGNSNSNFYTAKYAAADGALLWEKRYDSPASSAAYAVAVDESGNVVVTGTSVGSHSFSDYYTAKYAAANGALLWEKRLAGPASSAESSHYLALGPDGMVAVAGNVDNSFSIVVYREVPEIVFFNIVPGGVRLRFSGIAGRKYDIERAPAITGPWSTINTQVAPGSGLVEYVDANPPPNAAYYRISEP